MGVSTDVWRSRIGLFNHRLKSKLKIKPSKCQGSANIIAKFHFFVLLACLIIGNIEANPGPTYKCHACNFTGTSLQSILFHFKFHSNDKNFQLRCPHPFCMSVCQTYNGLSRHVDEVHSKEQATPGTSSAQASSSIVCQVTGCHSKFTTVKALCHHHLDDHIVKMKEAVPCPLVQQCSSSVSYSQRANLASHLSVKHKGWNKEGGTPMTAVKQVVSYPAESNPGGSNEGFLDIADVDEDMDVDADVDDSVSFADLFFNHIGKFYLKLYAECVLPRSTVQTISEELQIISELVQHNIRESLQEALRLCNLPEDKQILVMNNVCTSDVFYAAHHKESPGPTLSIEYFRDLYMKEKFCYVPPEEVHLDPDTLDGAKVQLVKPSLTLELLLKNQSIQKEILASFNKPTSSGKIENYTDGEVYKKRPSAELKTLDLIFFGDACTVTSHTKRHKIHGTYFTIANLKPHRRSKLDSIHMALLMEEPLLRDPNYGVFKCFKPLMDDMKQLEANGIKFMDSVLPVRVQFWVADSEGAHQMGGFTGNFSGDYFCRFCEVQRENFFEFPCEVLPFRTRQSIEAALAGLTEVQETRPDIVTFKGVKADSILNEFIEMDVTDPSLPPCLAHDLFEGVLDWDLSEILSNLVDRKWFSYQSLKRRIEGFQCKGSDSGNKPSAAVTNTSLGGHAVQNWTLARLLPFILEGKIKDTSDEFWQLYLLLKQVVDYACNPSFTLNDIIRFKEVLIKYMEERIRLLPGALKPKHHFLMHYAELVRLLGPLIHLFTLRFEAKHQFFKRISHASKNFINICSTLAKRHQIYLSYLCAGTIYPEGVGSNKPQIFNINDCNDKEKEVISVLGAVTKSFKFITFDDVGYKVGDYILAPDLNSIMVISHIVSRANDIYFIVKDYQINLWEEYGVYNIVTESEPSIKLIEISSNQQTPQPVYEFMDKICFSPKFPIKKE